MGRNAVAFVLALLLGAFLILVFGGSDAAPTAGSGSERPGDATTRAARAGVATTTEAAASPTPTVRESIDGDTQGLHGRVVAGDGTPVGGARIAAFERLALDPLSLAANTRRGILRHATRMVESGPDGRFVLPLAADVATGGIDLHALAAGHGDLCRPGLVVAEGEWRDLGDLPLPAGFPVTGVVLDATNDEPLPGARVTITLPQHRGLDLRADAGALAATTGTDGTYAIADVPEGLFSIRAEAPGHATVEFAQQHVFTTEANVVDFALPPGVAVDGIVTDADGRGIAGALVRGQGTAVDRRTQVTTTTDGGGRFALAGLPDGELRLVAAANGHTEATLQPVFADRGPVHITLRDQGRIRVEVATPGGAAVTRYSLVALGAGAPAMRRRHGPVRVAPDDLVDGAFTLTGLDAGDYRLHVDAGGHAVSPSTVVTVKDGETATVRVVLRDGATLRGRVVDARGRAIADARVTVEDDDAPGGDVGAMLQPLVATSARPVGGRSSADGTFELPHVAAGVCRLRFEHPDHATALRRAIEARDGATVDLGAVELRAGGAIRGLALVDDRADPTVVVQLLALEGGELPAGTALETRVDGNGAFAFADRLPAGPYAVFAGRRRADNAFLENADRSASRTEVRIDDGEQREVRIVLRNR